MYDDGKIVCGPERLEIHHYYRVNLDTKRPNCHRSTTIFG